MDPHVNPAPNASSIIISLFLNKPLEFASSKAKGIDAADVLPCLFTVIMIFSLGRLIFLAIAQIILSFA